MADKEGERGRFEKPVNSNLTSSAIFHHNRAAAVARGRASSIQFARIVDQADQDAIVVALKCEISYLKSTFIDYSDILERM